MCHYNSFSVSVFVQSSDTMNKSTYLGYCSQPWLLFLILKKVLVSILNPDMSRLDQLSVYRLCDQGSEMDLPLFTHPLTANTTRTLSQFHSCKPGNLLWWHDGVQCWQKHCLPFFLLCVALLSRLRIMSKMKSVKSLPEIIAELWSRVSWRKSYNLVLAFREKPPMNVGFPTKILRFGNGTLYSHELETVAMCNFVDVSFDYGR